VQRTPYGPSSVRTLCFSYELGYPHDLKSLLEHCCNNVAEVSVRTYFCSFVNRGHFSKMTSDINVTSDYHFCICYSLDCPADLNVSCDMVM
jgi:hypothetical protein